MIDGVAFGQNPDVNRDGLVNLLDLIVVGDHFGDSNESPAAPEHASAIAMATIRFENPPIFRESSAT